MILKNCGCIFEFTNSMISFLIMCHKLCSKAPSGASQLSAWSESILRPNRHLIRHWLIRRHPLPLVIWDLGPGFCLTLSWYISNSWALSVTNPQKEAEAACGCTEQKGSLTWTGIGTKTPRPEKGLSVTLKSTSVPEGIRKHQPKSTVRSANRSSIGRQNKAPQPTPLVPSRTRNINRTKICQLLLHIKKLEGGGGEKSLLKNPLVLLSCIFQMYSE